MSTERLAELIDAVAEALDHEREVEDSGRRRALLSAVRAALQQWREGQISDGDAAAQLRAVSQVERR